MIDPPWKIKEAEVDDETCRKNVSVRYGNCL
jgi:hypothetical protein